MGIVKPQKPTTCKVMYGVRAAAREKIIIHYLGEHARDQTFSQNIQQIPKLLDYVGSDHGKVDYDKVRVTLLDLEKAELIEILGPGEAHDGTAPAEECDARAGWKLTEAGWEAFRELDANSGP